MVHDPFDCNFDFDIKRHVGKIKTSSVGIHVSFILDLREILDLGCQENTGIYQIGDQRRIFFCGRVDRQALQQGLRKLHRYFI